MAGAKRNAKVELTSSASGMDKGLNDARRKMRAFERDLEKKRKERERAEKQGARATMGLGKSIATGMAAAAGFDMAGGIGSMVKDVFDVEKEMTRFQIDAQLSGQKMAGFREEIMKTSEASGQSRLDIIKGAHAYQILTGDAEGAVKASSLFAEVANASGASMEDIAATAASLKQNLGFNPDEFRKGFDVLLNLGHKGSIELRDMASQMAGLAPQFKEFGSGDSTSKLIKMGAAMETIKFNFADSAETATGFRAAMTALSKSKVADKLAGFGVNVWRIDPQTKKHVKADFFDIIADIKKKIPDQKVLADVLGGRQESFRAITAMLDHYKEMTDLAGDAANSDQVAKDAHTYMESASGRIARAWEHVKNSLAEAFTPERIDNFANALIKASDAFAKVVSVASQAFSALQFLTNGGTDKDTDASVAEQETFVDALNQPGRTGAQQNQDEKDAIAHARRILLMSGDQAENSDNSTDTMDFGYAKNRYGGWDNMQAGARRFLKSEGADLNQIDNQTTANGMRFAQGKAFDEKALVTALVDAMKWAGIGAVKVGSEPLVKATGNAMAQRTRPGGRR